MQRSNLPVGDAAKLMSDRTGRDRPPFVGHAAEEVGNLVDVDAAGVLRQIVPLLVTPPENGRCPEYSDANMPPLLMPPEKLDARDTKCRVAEIAFKARE